MLWNMKTHHYTVVVLYVIFVLRATEPCLVPNRKKETSGLHYTS